MAGDLIWHKPNQQLGVIVCVPDDPTIVPPYHVPVSWFTEQGGFVVVPISEIELARWDRRGLVNRLETAHF